MIERNIVIGDIHGCIAEFELLLQELNYNPQSDQLYCVGDLIHKGPESTKVIALANELRVKTVLGNNEAHFVKAFQNQNIESNQIYLEKLFGDNIDLVANYILEMPLWMDLDDFWLVHAGFDPKVIHPKDMNQKILLTIRTWDGLGLNLNNWPSDPAWYEAGRWDKLIIFGHWAAKGLVLKDKFIGLDTGCVYGKQLSAYCLEEKHLYQVQALDVYQAIK